MALASFVVARLVADRIDATEDDRTQRAARSVAAKGWLATLALPQAVRSAAARCADMSVDSEVASLAVDIRDLILTASSYLNAPSRNELDALAQSLGG